MTTAWPEKLLWIDLEMTGLDPEHDRITEVGAVVTDFDFNEMASYEALIKQSQAALARMKSSDWYDWSSGQRQVRGTVYDMHNQNGLIDKIKQEGLPEKTVESHLLKLIAEHFSAAVYLAGNSIHQDRRFIRRWWPRLEEKLHYRMLDVSSFKVYMQGKYHIHFQQPDSHRAIDGIRGSIAELKHYTKKIQV